MKKQSSKKPLSKTIKPMKGLRLLLQRLKERRDAFLKRRPHRSFRPTSRRDYARSLTLPGHWAFTVEVWQYIWKRRKTLFLLSLLYAFVTVAFVGIASQSTYMQLSGKIKESGGELLSGNWGEVGHAGLLLLTGVSGSLNAATNDAGKIIATIIGLLMWLTTIWLLRIFMSGEKPRLRDGLYNAGAPIVPMVCIFATLLLQLIPFALAALAFGAASSTGFASEGIEAMVFWAVEILLIVLSLYWLSTTLFAAILVTLPGMYPLRAFTIAGDLVVGRRLRILLRFVWLFALTFAVSAAIMIPIILFDEWLKNVWTAISWLPLVPICVLLLASVSLMWIASYTYMLYRKVVDDDTAPA